MSAKLREITKRPRAWLDANCRPWPDGLYVDAQGFLYQEGGGAMSDIAEKLRQWAGSYEEGSFDTEADLMGNAADEIDRLRAELRELTEPISDAGHIVADGLRAEIDRLRERVVKLERSQLETSIENNRLREQVEELERQRRNAWVSGFIEPMEAKEAGK